MGRRLFWNLVEAAAKLGVLFSAVAVLSLLLDILMVSRGYGVAGQPASPEHLLLPLSRSVPGLLVSIGVLAAFGWCAGAASRRGCAVVAGEPR